MNWNNVSLVVLGLAAFFGAFFVALWASLVIWTFRDMRARTRDAFAQFLASLMVLVLGPFGIILYFILRPRETLAEKYERSLEEEALLQDIEERQICPGCKQPIQPDYVLCPICHTGLRHPCIHCGRLIHPRWSLCPYCGQGQKPIPGLDHAVNVTLQDLVPESQAPDSDLAIAENQTDAFEMQPAESLDTEAEELPETMKAELQKEADASMAAVTKVLTPTEPEATGDADATKRTVRPRLPFGGRRDDSADADAQDPAEPEPGIASEGPTTDRADPDTGTGTRQPLSLFRRQ
jgi:hypothetical protein